MSKKTAVLGATPNPSRYAFMATNRLKSYNHEVIPIGIKKGEIAGEQILDLRQKSEVFDVDTVTMYIGPRNQTEWEDYILSMNPKRIIFNPGSENPSLAKKAQERGIEVEYGCTLVMLSANQY